MISLIPLLRNMVAELSFIDDAARNHRDPGIHDADLACSVKPAQRVRLTIAVLGHALDVTEFVQARKALHASEQRFRALIEHSQEMIVILDAQGTVRYESPSALRILGCPLGESIGKSGFTFVHPEDLPRVTESFSRVLLHTETSPLQEVRVRHQDGSWHTLEFSCTNLLAEPAVAGIVINSRDITHRKEAEHA
jgi:PAS domain S-box-containing protein